MKRIVIAAASLLFLFTTATPGISKDYNRDTKGRPYYKERPAGKNRPGYRGQPDIRDRREYRGRPDYHGHPGYRERPYDKKRNYVYRDYKGHRYTYHGHWRSWDKWDRYRRKHSHMYKHGRYYRENAHLMFRFCEPGTGNCFFFSIGR